MKKNPIVLCFLIVFIIISGCSSEETKARQEKEKKEFIANMKIPALNNDLKDGKLIRSVKLDDGIEVTTKYSTSYDTSRWKITDNKTLTMELQVKYTDTRRPDVFVEHMHADVSVASMTLAYNGLKQDSMDSKLHTGLQIGPYVNDKHSFIEIFAIEGLNKDFLSGWVSIYGGSISSNRYTEDFFATESTIGTKFQVVWKLMIQPDGEKYSHTHSFVDEFYIPIQKMK